jgi:hypothetical protein
MSLLAIAIKAISISFYHKNQKHFEKIDDFFSANCQATGKCVVYDGLRYNFPMKGKLSTTVFVLS